MYVSPELGVELPTLWLKPKCTNHLAMAIATTHAKSLNLNKVEFCFKSCFNLSCFVLISDEVGAKLLADQKVTKSEFESLESQPTISFHLPRELEDKKANFDFECVLYYCGEDGACSMKGIAFKQPLWITKDSVDLTVTMPLTYKFS